MADVRGYLSDSPAPSAKVLKVTPDDDANLPHGPCRALWVGTAGTANLVDAAGNDLDDFPLKEGANPISVQQVKTGGTADDIWALY